MCDSYSNFFRAITEENKGFKMLAKMGWKSGDTLGTSGVQGLVEPVSAFLITLKFELFVKNWRRNCCTGSFCFSKREEAIVFCNHVAIFYPDYVEKGRRKHANYAYLVISDEL